MFCLLWSTILAGKIDDVEEGGIKIKKMEIFFRAEVGKVKKFCFILFQITTFGCWRVC
jgi:hypothetical protein